MSTAYALRPLERTVANQTLKEGLRVHLSEKELRSLHLANGDIIRISCLRTGLYHGYGVAWLAKQTNPGNKPIAKTTDLLREKLNLTLSDSIFIEKANDASKPIDTVHVSCIAEEALARYNSRADLTYWISYALMKLEIILPDCTFDVQPEWARGTRNSKLRATTGKMEPAGDDSYALHFDPLLSKVVIENSPWPEDLPASLEALTLKEAEEPAPEVEVLQVKKDGIGGLSDQISLINTRLGNLNWTNSAMISPLLRGPETFLIHGPEGCGKTMLLNRIAECCWRKVIKLDNNWLQSNRREQSEALSTDVFDQAREEQPSLVLMDDLDKFLRKGEDLLGRLREELQKLAGTQVVVAAAARSVYDVDASLRTPLAFKTELELPPPNVRQREEMLREIITPGSKVTNVDFVALAERSHGYVGRDIHKLCSLARNHRVDQIIQDMRAEKISSSQEELEQLDFVTQEDFEAVIDQVQPTVLKDSILEVPKIRWTDIAGVDHVRTLLEDITVRPYKLPDLDIKFGGAQSRKGVLLYGPPGCAKTLIAQAVATESNLNFLAVKGSELIKMYVGESERAIRDVFRRARAAKPCIIFFDEIDSIGKSREKTNDSGLNVVTTLLNEMDGIEALKDVFIIGATNRPDILDSALIRTGRFDAHIHIGLPTKEARRQIIDIHTRKRPLAPDVDVESIALRTEGSSGADIKGLCTIAIEMAKSDYVSHPDSEPLIRMEHFERALVDYTPHTDQREAAKYEGWRPGKSLGGSL